jgi:hypothetical protein
LINPENAQRCDCGYDFEQKRTLEPYQKTSSNQMSLQDKIRFCGGLLFCFLSGDGPLISAERLGSATATMIMAFIVAHIWKGRKKPYDWKGVSEVFLYAVFVFLFAAYFGRRAR